MVKRKNSLVQDWPKVIEERVGRALAKLRSEQGLTQREVGDAANLTQKAVSRIELGSRITRIRDVVAIANTLGYKLIFTRKKSQ